LAVKILKKQDSKGCEYKKDGKIAKLMTKGLTSLSEILNIRRFLRTLRPNYSQKYFLKGADALWL
jgi:hypothetical protein